MVKCYMKAMMKLSQVKVEGEDSKEFTVRVGIHQGSILLPFIFAVVMDVVIEVAREGHAIMYADDLVLICETKEEARQRFVAWRNALESKGLKVNISKTKVNKVCMGWCTKGGSSGSMQCVWKEGGCELSPLCNMWLLGTRAMFRSARKFGKSGTGLNVQRV